LSAEPAPTPEGHIIPQSILEAAIKITNEPPTGMQVKIDFHDQFFPGHSGIRKIFNIKTTAHFRPICTRRLTTLSKRLWRCAPRKLSSRASSSHCATFMQLWLREESLVHRVSSFLYIL